MIKHNFLFFLLSLSVILAGCSKSDPLSDAEEGSEEGGGTSTSYAPKDVKNKVFRVSGQSFVVTFKSNESCTVSEILSGGGIVTGTPSCTYTRLSNNQASIQFTYMSKLTISSNTYSLSTCSYNFTLDFTQEEGGNAQGTYHFSFKTVAMGHVSTSEKNGNITKSFTLN